MGTVTVVYIQVEKEGYQRAGEEGKEEAIFPSHIQRSNLRLYKTNYSTIEKGSRVPVVYTHTLTVQYLKFGGTHGTFQSTRLQLPLPTPNSHLPFPFLYLDRPRPNPKPQYWCSSPFRIPHPAFRPAPLHYHHYSTFLLFLSQRTGVRGLDQEAKTSHHHAPPRTTTTLKNYTTANHH